jgi:hypothetical protein
LPVVLKGDCFLVFLICLKVWVSGNFHLRVQAALKLKTFNPGGADKTVEPKIRYRTTSYSQMADQEYSDWHKLSSRDDWGLFVHTFNTLVPQQEYAQTHPEYYSLIDGKRRPGTQLCLSNPEVLKLLVASLKNKIKEKPNSSYWSVSQDDNDRYCQCDGCKA